MGAKVLKRLPIFVPVNIVLHGTRLAELFFDFKEYFRGFAKILAGKIAFSFAVCRPSSGVKLADFGFKLFEEIVFNLGYLCVVSSAGHAVRFAAVVAYGQGSDPGMRSLAVPIKKKIVDYGKILVSAFRIAL